MADTQQVVKTLQKPVHNPPDGLRTMSRYRPPRQKSSPYITPEGDRALRDELHYLWRVKRPEVTQAVSEAAALGDRSENAEYIYGKKQLREIDRRVRYLQKRLDELTVVRQLPDDQDRVFFGAWVEVEDEQGNAFTYRLVGPDETDTSKGYISIDAPMARQLLKKTFGDQVWVGHEEHRKCYEIVDIRYVGAGDQ